MGLEIADSFLTYDTSQLQASRVQDYTIGGTPTIGTAGPVGPSGAQGGYLQLTSDPSFVSISVTSRNEYIWGFQYYSALTSGGNFMQFLNSGSGNILAISSTTAGQLTCPLGNSATGVLTASTYYAVMVRLKIGTSTGEFEVRVNGTTVIGPFTGINTGSSSIAQVLFQGKNSDTRRFSQFWLFNVTGSHSTTFPTGYMEVTPNRAINDGTYSQMGTHSGSAHYPQIFDTVADDDTTYVFDNVAGDRDSYGINPYPIPNGISQVHGTVIRGVARKDDVTPRQLCLFCKSGSTVSDGPTVNAQTSYKGCTYVLSDNPDTSAQWDVTEINAMEVGVKVVS